MLVITLSVLVGSLLWIYFRMKMNRTIKLAEKIPGPKPSSLLVEMLKPATGEKGAFKNVERMAQKYGPTFRIWRGYHLFIFLLDVKHIEAILSDVNLIDKSWTYNFSKSWLGNGLIHSTGEKWRSRRKLITPSFHFKILQGFVNVFNRNIDIMLDRLAEHVDGPDFDIHPYINLMTLDSICETSMGVKLNVQKDCNTDFVNATSSLTDLSNIRGKSVWLYYDSLFNLTYAGKLYRKCISISHAVTNNVIKKRKQELLQKGTFADEPTEDHETTGEKKRVPFLDMLIQSSTKDVILTDEDLRDEVQTVLSAGHDTSSAGIAFTCWMLALHQDIQEKVMLEVNNIFGDSDRPATFRDLQDMNYLELVIKETLRLYPVIPIWGRQLKKDVDIGEYVLPAGGNIFIVPYVLHRNEKYFPDPEKFDPDRFLPKNLTKRNFYSYIPFSAGPRNCVGQKYALLILKATVSGLLRRYKILPGNTEIRLGHKVSLTSLTGFNVKLKAR